MKVQNSRTNGMFFGACMFVLLLAASVTVFADSYAWVGGANGSWASSDSYSPKGTPGADDEVVLPTGTTCLDASDDDEFAAANAIKRIIPNDNCILEIDVGNKDRTLSFAFTYQAQDGRNRGKMIKKGSGSLTLGSTRDDYLYKSSIRYDYYSNFDIVEGALKLPQDGTSGISARLGNVAISNNATLFTLATPGTTATHTYVLELWGEEGAVITNTAPVSYAAGQVLSAQGSSLSVFAGKICSPIRWWGSGYYHLTGTNNALAPSSSFTQSGNTGRGFNGPYVGVTSFGRKGEPSSTGTYGSIFSRDNGGAFKYLGSGEETDVDLSVSSVAATPYPAYLSGGDVGGLVWKGLWQPAAASLQQRLVISGDGPKTNVMKGAIQRRTYSNTTYSFLIRKQGRGTWRIEDSSQGNDLQYQMYGTWGVDEGTLQFTSLAETNFISSLGMATECFQDYCGARDESKRVPYAFVLGGDTTEGTLEYVGTEDEFCSERPIWLYGDGAFKNSGTAKIRFCGVSSVTPAENPAARAVTFTLKGTGTGENEILDITDSVARPVSVVKEGSGTWVLGGEQSFHGALDVKEGTLILRRPEKYTWHRWTITSKEGTVGSANNYYQMQEFALFGSNKLRQNYGLELNSNYASLQPGQAAYGTDKKAVPTAAGRDLDRLFDDLKDSASGDTYGWNCTMRAPNASSGTQTPVRDNPFSWIPIVMRLPVGAEEVTSYDVVYYQVSDHVRSVTSYFVDGSVDGVHWDRLSTVDAVGAVSAGYWQYAATSFGAGGQRNNEHASGCPINSRPASPFDVLNNTKSVSVAAGATLAAEGDIVIPCLAADMSAGCGTISNFTFVASGSVDLTNIPSNSNSVMPGWRLEDCTDVANIGNWMVHVNGDPRSRWRVKAASDGIVRIFRPGFSASFR